MFKLKKVELLGFKSFADRTRLEFADGIAGIVGPNGCGKSNLADAISWVLGEQSARMLRGERMADVIFSGTSTRPPTGMAEVSLTLVDPEYVEAGPAEPEEAAPVDSPASPAPSVAPSNGDAAAGGAEQTAAPSPALIRRAGEVTVTRRLFRSGESEYLINGETCRLRDIQDLFMGTGLGPESYAIIEQGRIGQILSSKPSDRRAILEEAAGVSKFKTRKRLAEAKLESARQNLARITDILEEVTKQVNSLKRQASKARRYREMQEELKGRQKTVLGSRLAALEAECTRVRQELATLNAQANERAAELEGVERREKETQARYENLEAQLTQTRERSSQADLEQQRLASSLEQSKQQRAGLEERIQEAARESEQLLAQANSLDAEALQLLKRAGELRAEEVDARAAVEDHSRQKETLARDLASADAAVEASRQALLASLSDAAELRNQLVQAEEATLALERQASRVGAERDATRAEHAKLAAELEALRSEHALGEHSVSELASASAVAGEELGRARDAEAADRTKLEALRQEHAATTARRQALEESLARHAYSSEGVRRLLSGEIPVNGYRFRPLGLLADFVEVENGYEEVIEEFLKGCLECVVVEQHEEARSGIALLRKEGAGRTTFFVTRIPTNGHSNGQGDPAVRNTPGVVAPVRDLVRFEKRLGLNGDLALPELEHAYVVQDAAAAESLAGQFPEYHFLTASGEHYHHRLVSGGRGASSGPLAMRRDFRELERRGAELDGDLKATETALGETLQRIEKLEADLERLTEEKNQAEKSAVVASEKLRQAKEAGDRARERANTLEAECAALEAELGASRSKQQEHRSALEQAEARRGELDRGLAAAQEAARELRARFEQLGDNLAALQARLGALEERVRAADSEGARLASQREELAVRIARLEDQRAQWREEQAKLAREAEGIEQRLKELEGQREILRALLGELERDAATTRTGRDELAPAIDAARAALEEARARRSEAEVSLARSDSDLNHHAQTCRDELALEPAALIASLTAPSILSGEALQAAEEELRQLKARIEGLGAVNMMALEELQEAEERYNFLETQRQDLLASIEDTAQAIREIDEVSRQQFAEAFAAINGYFAESFRTLFGGGIGEMRMSDPADPDCGLDIVAQPPGKCLQNVLLLSGGEKALAALALLIAIFRYTPSPFCILDEVDAPLDETNVDRFTRMIREMGRHTQFILITHNKRTMEIARVLYGVTMEQPGVSKLVSVRFDEEPIAVPA